MSIRGFYHMGNRPAAAPDGEIREITIDHTLVLDVLPDFPVTFAGTYAFLADVANGGVVNVIEDIRIYADSALTALLPFEIVYWDNTTGEIELHFKTDLSDSVDTLVYLAYGNSTHTADVSDPTTVWSDYAAVFHMGDGTTMSAADATSVNNGTMYNTPAAVAGIVGGAGDFVAANSERIELGADASLDITGPITMQAWIKVSSTAADQVIVGGYDSSSPYNGYGMGVGVGALHKLSYWSSTTGFWVNGNTNVDDNQWHHVVVTVNSTTCSFYLNGQPDGTQSSNEPNTYTGVRQIATSNFFGSNYMTGTLDELRIIAGDRSPEWIETEFNNQDDPSTFYSVSAPI